MQKHKDSSKHTSSNPEKKQHNSGDHNVLQPLVTVCIFIIAKRDTHEVWLTVVLQGPFTAAVESKSSVKINCTPYLTPLSPSTTSLAFGSHCCLIGRTTDGTLLLERRASDLWSIGSDFQPVWKHPGWPFIHAPVQFLSPTSLPLPLDLQTLTQSWKTF